MASAISFSILRIGIPRDSRNTSRQPEATGNEFSRNQFGRDEKGVDCDVYDQPFRLYLQRLESMTGPGVRPRLRRADATGDLRGRAGGRKISRRLGAGEEVDGTEDLLTTLWVYSEVVRRESGELDLGLDCNVSELEDLEVGGIEDELNRLSRNRSELCEETTVQFGSFPFDALDQMDPISSGAEEMRIEADHLLGFVSLQIHLSPRLIGESEIEAVIAFQFDRIRENRDDHVIDLLVAFGVKTYVCKCAHGNLRSD